MKAAIVVTSINDCTELLNGYLANLSRFGREAKIYLIPDKKTPSQKVPSGVEVPSIDRQIEFLRGVNFFPLDIPFNSDNRRNVGYLMALADGAEMIVSIDDDNYCPENEDFIDAHYACMHRNVPCTDTEWVNNCDLLFREYLAYPRGFPYFARTGKKVPYSWSEDLPVHINAGMWIGDPDFDAITWLTNPPIGATYFRDIALGLSAWCPINSQNTAVHRDLMPAYWFVRMVPPSDRFGDIFQGYFALKVAKHMGWTARFGSPVVTHRRNSHVYLKDVQKEIEPILMLEELLPKLIEHKLTGTTVTEAYLSLADFIESQGTQFYSDTARLMRQWAETCRRING